MTGVVISLVSVVVSLVAEGEKVVLSKLRVTGDRVVENDVVLVENNVVSSGGLDVSVLVAGGVIGVDMLKCVVEEHGTY